MKFLFRTLVILMAVFAGSAGFAATALKVAPGGSHVGFSIRNFVSQTPGEFKTFDGSLSFSAAHPESSTVSFEVDVDSVDTGIVKRDEHLRSDDYFGAESQPKMTFASKAFKRVGVDSYLITGPLTIKGHSKDISVVAKLERHSQLWTVSQESYLFTTSFDVDRVEFGVGKPSHLLGSEVHVDLRLDFRAKS
jgi:polyisoprenoid-binding protein YceI